MAFELVVLKPFSGYKRGDKITDSSAISKILAGPQAHYVVRVLPKES